MLKDITVLMALLFLVTTAQVSNAQTWNDSFSRAKKTLETQVYYDHRITIYCGAEFDAQK